MIFSENRLPLFRIMLGRSKARSRRRTSIGTAFKVRRICATLAADGKTANLLLTADEQALKCELAPDAFRPVPNAWGARGATTAKLSALRIPELQDALTIAWRHAVPNKPRRRR
jgi:hypothetical protein